MVLKEFINYQKRINMTDNFKNCYLYLSDIYSNSLNGNRNNEFYFAIELIRRGKDNPDLQAANYHFKNYYIYSPDNLFKYETEIKSICDLLKLRAYISVSPKLTMQVALDTTAECARRVALHDYQKFYRIYESCSGKHCSKFQKWVVDVDNVNIADDVNYIGELENFINNMKSGHHKVVETMFLTKSGVHLITHPFDKKQFEQEFHLHFGNDTTLPGIKKEGLTLLYENI